jgi:hypothetical protein
VQQSAVLPRIRSQPVNCASENFPIIHRDSDGCQALRNVKSGERGIRTEFCNLNDTNRLQNKQNQRAAESGASQVNLAEMPANLQKLIHVWDDLPENIKQAIMLMIQPFNDSSADEKP